MSANFENSAVATGLEKVSFRSNSKERNVQTTTQLHSLHLLNKVILKILQLDFSSMWTENFRTYKLDLEKAKEPEIKLPTSTGSEKKQGDSRKTSIASLTTLKP